MLKQPLQALTNGNYKYVLLIKKLKNEDKYYTYNKRYDITCLI